jgi:hypothetical protein
MAPEMRGCGHIWTDAIQPLICPECLNTHTHIKRVRPHKKGRQVMQAQTTAYPSEFDAMGHPVPDFRRDNAYQWLRSIGIERGDAWGCVEAMSIDIERDHPHEAMERAHKTVDPTGAYRLLAILVTGQAEEKR